MRSLLALVLVALVAACGGEGSCAQPPCNAAALACRSNADCFQTEFCNFAQDTCGTSPMDVGVCDSRPSECTDELDTVCGCDGQFHSNSCAAERAGVDVSEAGGCPVPPGTFACGPGVCDAATEFCFKEKGSGAALGCRSLPQSCKVEGATCACFQIPGDECACTKDVGFTLSCPLDQPS